MSETTAKKIVLIFGSGPNIGASTVSHFQQNGYRVVYSSRSADSRNNTESTMALKCDLANPTEVENTFQTVRKDWGEPHVVLYNAYGLHQMEPAESFAISTPDFAADLTLNATSAFAALREAIVSFQRLPASDPKTFLFTGNAGNQSPAPGWLTLALGKAASAYMVEMADGLYRAQGVRCFYVDERTPEGGPMYVGLGGQAHAEMFLSMAERRAEVPWLVTFVSGQGYRKFEKPVQM